MNPITRTLNVDNLLLLALQEDISSEDVTTNAVMPEACQGTVQLLCKQDGVIAGMEVFARVFTLLDEKTEIIPYVKDGDEVKKGDLLATVNGDIRVLLSGERTALNYLQRMSGIATYTRSVAKLLEGSKTTLLDTRKTTPNMRIFEKYAVKIGGGQNHRYNLSDGVLLKDNHIGAAGSVTKAIEMARDYAPFVRKIEVECEKPRYGPRSSRCRCRHYHARQYDSGADERGGSRHQRQSKNRVLRKCDKRKYRHYPRHRRRLCFQRCTDAFCTDS